MGLVILYALEIGGRRLIFLIFRVTMLEFRWRLTFAGQSVGSKLGRESHSFTRRHSRTRARINGELNPKISLCFHVCIFVRVYVWMWYQYVWPKLIFASVAKNECLYIGTGWMCVCILHECLFTLNVCLLCSALYLVFSKFQTTVISRCKSRWSLKGRNWRAKLLAKRREITTANSKTFF